MLLPINTERFTNIVQSDIMLTYKNAKISAKYKPNYNKLFNTELSRPINYAEDNSIPIYDLNFTFLQSINLSSYDNVIDFLSKHNLLDFKDKNGNLISSQIVLNSENPSVSIKNNTSVDSIKLPTLISTLIEYEYLIGKDNIKTILQDLISKIDIFSSIRFLSPIGHITELNKEVINGFNSSILSTDFIKENIRDIEECFEEKTDYIVTPQILPQNTVLNGDLRHPLYIDKSIPSGHFYTKRSIPSSYYNIAYMKNNRTPHYNINYEINENDIPSAFDYIIDENFNVESTILNDKNKQYNDLFDIDITHSINAHPYPISSSIYNTKDKKDNLPLNKGLTINILNYAVSSDLQLANENADTYANMYPGRMITKVNDYLEPYKNYHVANNKLYNIGQLNGIRSYVHIGTLQDSDKLWFSYKYKTVSDQHFIDSFDESYNIEFETVELNREKNHWIYDIYGRPIINNKMKIKDQVCPWSTLDEKLQKSNNKSFIQKLIGCSCELNETCSGFCTFPANNLLNIPSGIIWDDGIKSQFHIISSGIIDNIDRELFVEENITVNDDLEIYFISGNNNTELNKILDDIIAADKSITTIDNVYKSIFQGFGNYIQNPNNIILSYLAINNTDENQQISGYTIPTHCPFNTAHIIPAGTKLVGLNWMTKEIIDYLPANYIAVFRVRSWWSDIVQCKGKIKVKVKSNGMNIDDMLNVVSNYDYVERNYGFFKYQQENMHKSNVYSVKITNSGLNPENNLKLKYIKDKKTLIKLLTDNIKANLYKELILVNRANGEHPLYDLYYDSTNNCFYSLLMDPNLLLSNKDIPEEVTKLPNNLEKDKIYHVKNDNTDIYYKCIIHNEVLVAFPINYYYYNSNYNYNPYDYKNLPTTPLPTRYLDKISLEEVAEKVHIKIVYDNFGKFAYAYDINEYERIIKINKIRNDMREMLENAIKTSVVKYMPVETTLWKIIYSGK